MPKTTILIPDGESTLAKHVIHCLAYDPSIEIHVLSKDPKSINQHSRFVKSFRVYDDKKITMNKPQLTGNAVLDDLLLYHHYDASMAGNILNEIIVRAKEVGATILLPVDEHIIRILGPQRSSIDAAGLKILMPDISMFLTAIDKWELSKFITPRGIPHPATVQYSKATTQSVADQLTFPVIIKPINQGNALGIRSFKDKEAFKKFFGTEKIEHEYIVQPLIKGYDIDCSVLCSNGKVIAYTIQKAIVHAAVEYRAAVGIVFLKNDEVIGVVEKMMKELNWSGVAHIDLRYDEEAKVVKVIEINARYWGSLLGSLNAGVNFPLLAIKTMLGETFAMPDFSFKKYFMGHAPVKQIVSSTFKKERVYLKDTSLFYSLRDVKPFIVETIDKIRKRF